MLSLCRWPSPGKPDFARVNTIEIVTNEMNVACKPKTTNKADFLTGSVGSVAEDSPESRLLPVSVDERRWMRFGCATCAIPESARSARQPDVFIAGKPGYRLETAAKRSAVRCQEAGGRSCLERYEYAKHGACFGFDPDAYFGTMVRRCIKEIKESEAGNSLRITTVKQ